MNGEETMADARRKQARRKPRKYWWQRATAKEAPSYVHDQAHTPESIWAQGYNDAVEAYLREVNDIYWQEIGQHEVGRDYPL